MHIDEIKRQTNPFHPYNIMVVVVSLIILAWCWRSTEMSVGAILDGWGNMITYISGNPEIRDSGFFPPTISGAKVLKYLLSMMETVQMAVLALILSVTIAFPASLFASRNTLNIIIPGNHRLAMFLKNGIYTVVQVFRQPLPFHQRDHLGAALCLRRRSGADARHPGARHSYFRGSDQALFRGDRDGPAGADRCPDSHRRRVSSRSSATP